MLVILSSATVGVIIEPQLQPLTLTKDDNIPDSEWAHPGGVINYTLRIENPNDQPVTQVMLYDFLPYEVDYLEASDEATHEYHTVHWQFDSIPAKGNKTVWLLVEVNHDAEVQSTISNYAMASSIETSTSHVTETTCLGTAPLHLSYGAPRDIIKHTQQNKWYTRIGPETPMKIKSLHTGGYKDKKLRTLTYEIYNGEQFGEWTLLYRKTVTDNQWPDLNGIKGQIAVEIHAHESCWHQIRYWCTDIFGNVYPTPGSTLRNTFVVDASQPTITTHYEGPSYTHGFTWITNSTQKIITAKDHGCTISGVGVHHIYWDVEEKIGQEWVITQKGVVYDNDLNDTDGTPANPQQENQGGIYALGWLSRPYVFQDINGNWSLDIDEPILHLDPDGDGLKALPFYGNYGGLYALDQKNEPYLFIDNNTDGKLNYDQGDWILNYDPDGDGFYHHDCDYLAYVAYPQDGQRGGLYAFDDHGEGFLFNDTNDNHLYDNKSDHLINLKPDYDGQGTITINLTMENDCEHYIFYQAVDNFDIPSKGHEEYVRVDSVPPKTKNITGAPRMHQWIDHGDTKELLIYLTSNTPITLQAEDDPRCAVGTDYIHYEIWEDQHGDCDIETLVHSKDETSFDDATFYLKNDSRYELRYYAVDKLGNKEEMHYQKFFVDNDAPEIEKSIYYPHTQDSSLDSDYWINKSTIIKIDTENKGLCPYFSVMYRLNRGHWNYIFHQLPYNFTLPDECIYELEIRAWDPLYNIAEDIDRFSVDDTPPEFEIIKPTDGWYSDGTSIPSIIDAVDHPNPDTPCDDHLAVGMTDSSHGAAALIDVFPDFDIIRLDPKNFLYSTQVNQFIGNLIIPETTGLSDGSILFVPDITDDLGNGQDELIEHLHSLYEQAEGDETSFKKLITSLLDDNQIVWIGMDNTPPIITITNLGGGSDIGPGEVFIKAEATDALSGLKAGTPCQIYLKGIPLGSLLYNPAINGCEGSVPIPSYFPTEEEIPLTIQILDRAGNTGQQTLLVDLTQQITGSPPSINMISPEPNSIHQSILPIHIEASDTETQPGDLTVTIEVNRQNDPPFTYHATYNDTQDLYIYNLSIKNYTDGSILQLKAYVTDSNYNTVISIPISCKVQSNIVFDQWMHDGWNIINLPTLGDNNGVENIFYSISDSFNWIFEVDTWNNYLTGRPINSLTTIKAGVWYWVHMENTEARFHIDGTDVE